MSRLPYHVVHYGGNDPRTTTGGVETFARNLQLIFENVSFMSPKTRDIDQVRHDQAVVICDNQYVRDWPEELPVIGFQHGVGAVKFSVTHSFNHWRLRGKQKRAAQRTNTLWVACAQWIARTFEELHGNGASHVIYHPIDVNRFDGHLWNEGSRLILHDARLAHKGRDLIPHLADAFPAWRFEPLDCEPADVPERMRMARAFVHLSRYEGNSIVCNEAMAMNLPCFFTRVGLMQDEEAPRDVYLVDPDEAYGSVDRLIDEFGRFAESLQTHSYEPRRWILRHATPAESRRRWQICFDDLQQRFGYST